jgi:FAD/FMN-containing dehydrogenase
MAVSPAPGVRQTWSGLALVSGINSETGLAGLTLGGGIGWLMRKYGLTIDHLISAELVTVGGEVLEVSAKRHSELFWAIRGGGGNFGIVTGFEFNLVPVGQEVVVRTSWRKVRRTDSQIWRTW